MAEFYRAAQVATRATSLLLSSTPRWTSQTFLVASGSRMTSARQLSTTQAFRSIEANNGARDPASPAKSPTSHTQNQSYSSASWPSSSRESRQTEEDNIVIKKPDISAYDEDPLITEVDFDSGELNKSKIVEQRPAPVRPPLRLVPRTGRTVHVRNNVDVARSFKLLSIQVNQNRVRQDFSLQKFHERPGLKRKRLKSARWRARFKKGFKACVTRVRELTKQGW
ncbi:uncharacterized protein F4822DRAFT_305192 [Hypoxylon trugodes]|uniref:uncharacterized protein n=1 Tax=Hypoxylon trugodes TaxID=326681 RepID=UPI0021921D4A|nr:uncharacterized protein F4822DRAFT_305192 [Hypoxylon trugodes]KAI1386090.1 hypothetical protein F4822DRAFT_305192 [Hypoxylon trugodes]